MNVKEFDDFFRRSIGHFPVFRPNCVQNCGFRFSVQNAKIPRLRPFSVQNHFVQSLFIVLYYKMYISALHCHNTI